MYNRHIIGGWLGADPESRQTSTGTAVCSFTVATSRWGGETRGKITDWHNVVTFGKLADNVSKFCQKGSLVLVEGHSEQQNWEKDGVKHYKTVLVADSVQFLNASTEQAKPAANKGGKW